MATTTIIKKTVEELKEVLSRYVKQNFLRNELLDFVSRDFSEHAWSLRALDRRLEFFNGTTWHTPIEPLRSKTQWEDWKGRENSLVTGDLVYTVMYDVDPGALAENNLRRRKAKGNFTSRVPNWVHSLDGHEKLIGYQNSTLPIAVYGCIDTCSQKMLWVKVWVYLY